MLGIVGSVTDDSRTRAAVERALAGAAAAGADTEVLHLAEYDLDDADGTHLDDLTGDTAAALELVVESDAYVVGSPVYRAAYSGALKNLLDQVPRGQWQGDVAPLENAAVGLVATGAADEHFLAIDEELRPLLAFFGVHTVGTSVWAGDDVFADGDIADEETAQHLDQLGGAVVELAGAIADGEHLSGFPPQV